MKKNKLLIVLFLIAGNFSYTSVDQTSGDNSFQLIENREGSTLGYSPASGIKIIKKNGLAFKDLNRNRKLDKYEDWRLAVDERAKDLASKMSIEQIGGLMLYSRHQAIPGGGRGFMAATYNGKPFDESGAHPADLSDDQKRFLEKDHLRHVLITMVQSPEVAANWNNHAQAFVEGLGMGIPINTSSDPRHGSVANAEFNAGAGGRISMWPSSLGLAATFDPALMENFGRIASIEYRALGIGTALSPQIDLATDPRWNRVSGTFGEDPVLATDMARAYIDGFQNSSPERTIANGWGYESVNAMVKHWPGGGTGESGRDAHYAIGKYAVYPAGQFELHMIPFTQGAFKLNGPTKMASAVMPYYTISYNQDQKYHENVGNSYNRWIITDLMRDLYKYDGVACTDWLVTGDETSLDVFIGGKSWGVEKLTVAERHYKALMAGIDQFGGNNDLKPVLDAYQLGIKEHGEPWMRQRFEQSAVRLLRNIFQLGLFENPYLDPQNTKNIVGNPEFMAAGYDAQLKSIVMVKNKRNVLPVASTKTVYIPKKYTPAARNFMGMEIAARYDYPISLDLVKKYYKVTEKPEEADFAIIFMESPRTGIGYDAADAKNGGNGYIPISLQYGTYKATSARATSLAGGDPLESFTNRSYKDKTVISQNITDLNMVTETYARMKGKPIIAVVNLENPMVFGEFEPIAQGILVHFGVQNQAILETILGTSEPSGLLPMQMPSTMLTVEHQAEDKPHDLDCYVDEDGHHYDFAFGLNWSGLIKDARTKKYNVK